MFTGMTGARARTALAGTRFADLTWVAETGSTNADLLEAARSGAGEGVANRVQVADHQTAGRGRLGRSWQAPPEASLMFSVLLTAESGSGSGGWGPEDGHLLTAALGLATVDVLGAGVGDGPPFEVGLKWPNDLVAPTADGERKLAGILAESVVADGRLAAVVIGMGLNVRWGPVSDLPPELAGIAVSLDQLHPGEVVDRQDLLVAILRAFDRRLDDLGSAEGRARLHADHVAACVTLGREVRVELADGVLTGRATGLAPGGQLVVAPDGGGEPMEVTAGDVIHLR